MFCNNDGRGSWIVPDLPTLRRCGRFDNFTVFDYGTGEYNYHPLVTTTSYPWGRPLAGSQYQHWDRPRRSGLVSLVMVAKVLVDDLPQPGIARVTGQHRPGGNPESLWADVDLNVWVGLSG
jgi:hypothetical protein